MRRLDYYPLGQTGRNTFFQYDIFSTIRAPQNESLETGIFEKYTSYAV
jgi:hypothetical protein